MQEEGTALYWKGVEQGCVKESENESEKVSRKNRLCFMKKHAHAHTHTHTHSNFLGIGRLESG